MMEPKEQCEGSEAAGRNDHDWDVRLVDYVYGELSSDQEVAFEKKLEQEPELERDVFELQRVLEIYRSEPPREDPSSSVTGRILAAAAEAAPKRKGLWSRLTDWMAVGGRRYALAGAAAVALICAGVVSAYYLELGGFGPSGEPEVASRRQERNERFALALEKEKRPAGGEGADGLQGQEGRRAVDERAQTVASGEEGETTDQLLETTDTPAARPREEPWETPDSNAVTSRTEAMTSFGFYQGEKKETKLAERPTGGLREEKGGSGKRWRRSMKRGLAKDGERNRNSDQSATRKPSPSRPAGADDVSLAGGKGDGISSSRASGKGSGESRIGQGAKASPEASGLGSAVALQRKGKHRRAARILARLARSKSSSLRSRALLLWAESEIALGNRAKARKLLAMVRRSAPSLRAKAKRVEKRLSRKKKPSKKRSKKPSKKPPARKAH
jgi:hypothetical protein